MITLLFCTILMITYEDMSSSQFPIIFDSTVTTVTLPQQEQSSETVTYTTFVDENNVQLYSSELLSCMGKLRLACGVNSDVNRIFNRYVSPSRLDKINDVFREEARILCKLDENDALEEFMNEYTPAIQIAEQGLFCCSSSSVENRLHEATISS
ncbi:hypothetical protein DICVIV_06969 [Dictyocaulus viviparus]|uniref:Uncharacterized protein n=1 Tax=Dictyocaulus viviparus TaxID=29172 RepID=A0A0D8XT09_DICVI|nr:hypothetical protein DICVIV_06969 [Dictyocaulus viviparus]